jgi:hypothetical protein
VDGAEGGPADGADGGPDGGGPCRFCVCWRRAPDAIAARPFPPSALFSTKSSERVVLPPAPAPRRATPAPVFPFPFPLRKSKHKRVHYEWASVTAVLKKQA